MSQAGLLVLNDLKKLRVGKKGWTFGRSQHLLNYIRKYIKVARVDEAQREKNLSLIFKDFAKKYSKSGLNPAGVKAHYAELTRAIAEGYKDLRKYYQDARPCLYRQVGGPGAKKPQKNKGV